MELYLRCCRATKEVFYPSVYLSVFHNGMHVLKMLVCAGYIELTAMAADEHQ